jgi:hypothetical protein
MGRKRLQFAFDAWSRCMRSGQWPGYPRTAVHPEYPGWRETQWLNREVQAEQAAAVTERAADHIMGG